MCIRDSLQEGRRWHRPSERGFGERGDHGGRPRLGGLQEPILLGSDDFEGQLPDGRTTEAVSYTHLDVYKRQGESMPAHALFLWDVEYDGLEPQENGVLAK